MKYLRRRRNVFEYYRRLPQAVRRATGKQFFVKSLGTRSQAEAKDLMAYAEVEFHETCKALLAEPKGPEADFQAEVDSVVAYLKQHRGESVHETLAQYLEVSVDRHIGKVSDDKIHFGLKQIKQARQPRLTDLLDSHLKALANKGSSQHTIKTRRRRVQQFIDWTGKQLVSELTADDGWSYADVIATMPVGQKTKKDELIALRAWWQYGVDNRYCQGEVFPRAGKRFPQSGREADKRNPWTPEEAERMLQALDGEVRSLFAIALYTGMRSAEITNLKKADCLVENGHVAGLKVTSGKTKSSKRTVPVHPAIQDLVDGLYEKADDSLFTRSGNWLNQKFSVTKCEQFPGRPDLVLHSCRHLVQTSLGAAGVSPTVVDQIMGHAGHGIGRQVYLAGLPLANLREALSLHSLGAVDSLV